MKKNKLPRYFIFISAVTLLSIWLMLIYNSYHKLNSAVNQAKIDPIIKPINPDIDLDVAREIETRLEYHQSDLNPDASILIPEPGILSPESSPSTNSSLFL